MSEIMQRTEEEVAALAEERGLVYFLPESNELFIDLDEPPYKLDKKILALCFIHECLRVQAKLMTVSPGGHRHVYLKMSCSFKDTERIIIQMALGSDKKKEVLSLLRIREHAEAYTTLFETPEEAEKVKAWRKRYSTICITSFS